MASIEQVDIQLVAVSYDSVDILAKFGEENKITFPLLSDPESKTIDAYGVRNEDVREGSRQEGIPHPGTFLIAQDGVIRARLFYTIRKRHSPRELIEAAEKLEESAAAE